jgi:hypothetical protein
VVNKSNYPIQNLVYSHSILRENVTWVNETDNIYLFFVWNRREKFFYKHTHELTGPRLKCLVLFVTSTRCTEKWPMLNGCLVITTWRALSLWMRTAASRYGRQTSSKHFWLYISCFEQGSFMEETPCMFNEVSAVAIFVSVLPGKHNLITLNWRCDDVGNSQALTHAEVYLRHTTAGNTLNMH